MSCIFCGEPAHYRDRYTGQHLCPQHARLEVRASEKVLIARPLAIRQAAAGDLPRIEELSIHFWDETVVDCFCRKYDVLACPAFLACDSEEVVGLACYAIEPEWDAVVLVLLNALPDFQGRGAGRLLLDSLCSAAVQDGLVRILVATSNDDLPALALYQRYGFQITGVSPGLIARHHGAEFPGFSGIPIRDEIQLELRLPR
jgi:GNAT superfamily N-acetyltransferase